MKDLADKPYKKRMRELGFFRLKKRRLKEESRELVYPLKIKNTNKIKITYCILIHRAEKKLLIVICTSASKLTHLIYSIKRKLFPLLQNRLQIPKVGSAIQKMQSWLNNQGLLPLSLLTFLNTSAANKAVTPITFRHSLKII